MRLEGSCHCQAVSFSLDSQQPWPYQRCYCSICRKTGGSGGYMINLGGDATTLEVSGAEHLAAYQAMVERQGQPVPSRHKRYFCTKCGSHVYAINDRWPELVHPVASAIDSDLPPAPQHVHMMVGSKASWVPDEIGPRDEAYDAYPGQSLAAWHAAHGYDGG
jgi:hypothetical protein